MTLTKLANGNFKSSGLVFRMTREGLAVPVNCSVADLVKVGLSNVSPSLHESLDWASKLTKPGDVFSESLVDYDSGREILTSRGMRYPRADEYASFVSAGGSYQGWLSLAFNYDGKTLTAIIDPGEPFSESRSFVEQGSGLYPFADFIEFIFGRTSHLLPHDLLFADIVLCRGFSHVMVAGEPSVFRADQSHSYLSGVRIKDELV